MQGRPHGCVSHSGSWRSTWHHRRRLSELPRLLFCCFDVVPAPHATSRRLSEYLKGLSERYQVVVLTVKTPDHSHIERYQGARLLRVPVGSGDLRSRMEAFDRAVRRQLESEEYLLVHFFDPVSGYPLCERRGDFGYKLIYDACRFPSGDLPSLVPQEGSNKRLLARSRRQELFCLMNADAVIVGSEAAKAHCVSLGVPAQNVSVVRAPVDLAPYSPELMGQPDQTPARLIHLGSHGRHQDLPLLLEALSKAKTPVRLALVGPSSTELTPPLKERAAELGLSERVEFQEPVGHDDIHKVIAAADIGVLTLTDEPRNRTTTALARIGEFLAAGRPIIAADLPLTRELVPAGATRFYTPGDVQSLADAIDALAADGALRRTMGAAARTATEATDASLVREKLIALYERVAPGARAPADHVDAIDPADATQLGGRPPDELGDVTQASVRVVDGDSAKHDVGTNKVKTDPAVVVPAPEADTGTDQSVGRGERPPVMGVLLRNDAPPVPPETTDPALTPSGQLPTIMGLPVSDRLPDVDAVEAPAPREGPPVPDEEPATVGAAPSPLLAPPVETPTPAPQPPPPAARPNPLLSTDDEPLDFANLLKPSAPVRMPTVALPMPDITAPIPQPPQVRAPAPVPIQVPTSFSLPTPRPSNPPPGATFVPVPIGVQVSTVPARVPLPPPPAPPLPRPPPMPGGAVSPSGVRPVPPVEPPAAAGPTSPSGLRAPPPLPPAETAGSASGVRAPPPLPSVDARPSAASAPPSLPALPSPQAVPEVVAPLPPLTRLVPNPAGPGAVINRTTSSEDVVELRDDELELLNDESIESLHDGDDEAHDPEKEIDAGELHALETSAAPPPSRLDPWFAQLVHGYCPPESQLFTRHVPPTTMPGRDT